VLAGYGVCEGTGFVDGEFDIDEFCAVDHPAMNIFWFKFDACIPPGDSAEHPEDARLDDIYPSIWNMKKEDRDDHGAQYDVAAIE
jgi:hypothetical protein